MVSDMEQVVSMAASPHGITPGQGISTIMKPR